MESKNYYYPKEAYEQNLAQENSTRNQSQNTAQNQSQNTRQNQNMNQNFNLQSLMSIMNDKNPLSQLSGGSPQLSMLMGLLGNKKKSETKPVTDQKYIKVSDYHIKEAKED